MTTLAIVVTLVGQAWAENANGERRALEVGDQLAVDETLIMAEGARIDLDFGDNQQLTFLGEQQVTPEVRGDLIEQTESLSSLETNDLPEPVTPIESDRGGLSEGHSFVQLVRIGEIIEADGYTPVTVARIQEVLRPFGMSIPQQEFVRGSERDGTRYDEQSYPETGLKLAKLSISIDAITGDDIVDATEAGQPVTLTGTVGGGVSPGDTVAVTVNGQLYNTTVNADGRTWQVDVPGSELAKDNKVQATVNSVEPNGTPVSESAERPYWADDITPSVSVELEQGSGPNGEFNESDTNDGKVEGRITFGPNSKPGDTITVTDKDGNPILDGKGDPITDYEITQGDIDNGITVEVPVTPGQTDVELKVDITDSVGNTSSASDNKAVDNVGPQLRVEIEGEGSIAHYDAAKITNGQAKVTVKLIAGAVEAGDQLIVRDGNGNTVINRPVTDAEVASGEVDVLLSVAQGQTVVNVEAVITDPAGNSSNDTDGKVILSPDLAIDTAQIDDAAGTIDISGSTSDVAPGSDVVITITDKDGNTVSVTAQTNASGDYTITGQDISGLTDGPLDIKAETTDHNGKTVDDSVADAIDHIAGGLSVDTTTVASTGPTVDISGSSTDVHPGETVTVTITDQDGTTVTTSAIVQADGTYTVIGTDISSLVDGPLTIDASATDNNGNPVSGSDTAELDSLAGSMTVAFTNDPIADPALAQVEGTTVDVAPGETINLTFTDVNGQTTTATAVVANDGTYTTTVDLRGLTDGTITVDATATDRNSDPVNATNDAVLDAVASDIAIDSTSVDDGAGTIDISGSTTDVAPNTTVSITITDKDGNDVSTTATTDANGDYVVNGTDISGLTDGPLTITAETTDHNGNTINASATDALDHVAGDLTVDTTTVDDGAQTVDISGSSTDVHPGETVTITIKDQDGNTVTTTTTVNPDGSYNVSGTDISSLVDGPLTIEASSTDNNGNPVTGTGTGELDNVTGAITVEFATDPVTDAAVTEVTGTTTDVAPGEIVNLTFTDQNANTVTTTAVVANDGTYTTTVDLRGLTDGNITVDAAATDRNSDPVTGNDAAVLDAVAADIAIDTTSVDDAAGTIDIAGSTTDVAPNTTVNITITDKDGNDVSTTATTDANGDYVVNGTDISGLTDGPLTITAETTDHNGNSINASANDNLDYVTGDLTVDTTTVDDANQTVDISGNSTDVHPGETVTITIKDQDGTEVITTTTVNPDGSYDVTGTDISSLVDGPLTIEASSTDNNGNPVTGTGTGELDNLADAISVNLDDITSANQASVTVTGNTTDVLPGETVNLTFTDGTNTTTAIATVAQDGSYVTVVDLRGLDDGPITVGAETSGRNQTVTANDNAIKDVQAPSLTIASDDATLAGGGTTNVTFTFSEEVTGFDATDITVAGGTLTNLTTSDNIIWTADFTADGTGDISIEVADDSYTDMVGNLGTGNDHAINTAPTASDITLSAEDAESFVYEADALFTDADSDTLTYSANNLPAGLAINANTGLITGVLDSSASQTNGGVYTIEVTVNDGQGGTNTADITLNVTNPAPVVAATIEDKTFDDSDTVSIQTSQAFKDPDGDTITYSASNLPSGLTIDANTGVITGTLASSASQGGTGGDYSVTVTANDGEGGSVDTSFTISINNPAPVVDPVQGVTADDGEYVEIQTQFSDPDSDALSYTILSGAPAGFTIDSSGKISGTLASNASQLGPDSDGYYHIIVQATDADGATVTDTIELLAKNPAPVISAPISDATADDGDTFTLDTSTAFNDPDGDSLTYSATGLPGGLTIDSGTGEISGTLSNNASQHGVAGDGKYTVVVTADDGQGGTVSDIFELEVRNTVPEAINDAQSTDENVVLNIGTGSGVLNNDTDSNGDNLTVTAVSDGGTNVLPGQAIAGSNGGIFRIFSDGSYSFDPNGEFDSLAVGENQQSSVTYTVSDGKGGTDTAELTITINGVNNPPVAENDQVISDASGVTIDVLNNDSDVDASDTLTITQVNGSAITAGNSVTIAEGEVTLNASGSLTFVPDSSFTGNQANFDYTISDGTATATATVTVDVIRVNITDDNSIDASLAQQNTPDGTLADIDDLANTQITGSIPQGGSVVSLVISDGTNSINVDPNTIAIYPNGNFVTTVDTTGLDDGNISVTLVAQNSQGDTGTSTDTIYKDTVTDVEIDPLNVVNGEVPVVTGTGEPGATVVVSVDDGTGKAKVGEAIVDGGGNWTFTPTNPIDPSFEVIADATDKWGNTEDVNGNPASDSRDIPSLDTGAAVEVDEAGLAIGSDAGNKPIEVSSSFTLGGNDDLQHLVVDGTTVTKAALENLGATPVTITQGHYTIELTGYNSGTGEVNYTYTLTDPVAHDAPPSGTDSDTNVKEELITVVVVDVNNDTRTGQITVEITDDVPATPVDDTAVTVEEGAVAVGSANTGDNLLANDVLGADGGQVHDISYTDRSGVTQTNVGVPAAGLTVDTQYGELTVNQDGSWSYTPVDSADHVKATNDTELGDNFSYRVIDNDGDISSSSATQAITVTDTVPVVGTADNASVDEANLTAGSTPNNGALTQTGSLAVTKAADDIDTQFVSTTVANFTALGLTSGGTAISYVLSGDGHTLTASAGANTVFTATITNPSTASAGYEFVLSGAIDHVQPGNNASLDLPFNFIVTDSDNDTATGSFNVTVVDDVPVAADDSNTVAEASYAAVTGNVISTGAGADNQGADGATVTDVTFGGTSISPPSDNSISTINGTYGVLTIQADGSYSYQRNAGTAGGVNDEFSYTLTDGDGDTASATLTVTISDAPVAITNLTPQASGGDATVLESKLTGGTNVGTGDANATGSFTISSADGIAELSITHDGNTYNLVLSNTAQVLPTITTALGNTLEITGYDAGTGVVSYTYTLASEEAHSAQGQDDLFENFTINLEDMDGDSTTGDLAVRIVDDIPLITQNITNTAAVEVDESNFANSTENFSGLFSISHGADGTAITDATVYTLDANTISGLVDTASGAPVTLSANANGTVVTGTADGNTVFTIAIDSATGDITLDQSRAVRHSDTSNHNDSVAIDTAAVSIVATATDGDGDEVTSTIAIGDRFTFLDDGPSITVNATQVGAIELDETNLTGASHSTTNANFAAGVFTTDFGADGAASTAGFVYSLTVSGNAVSSGLTDTASGEDVLLRVNGSGEVEGYTAGGNQIVFTVSVDSATGALTLEQVRTLSHPDTTNHDDVVSILDSTIQLVGTATDGDGDTAEQSINIGGQITFRDDGPSITAVTAETTVDEKGLQAGSAPDGNLLTASASLNVDFGGDGAGDVQFTAATVTALEGLSLKAGGTGLEFVIDNDNHSLTAYRGAGRAATDKVFTVEITNPTSAPSYDFELQTPIDHGGAADLTLAFQGIQVTDGDGDSVTKGFNVKVVDDVSQSAMTQTVDEDSSVTFNTSADANPTNTTIYDQADNALARTGNGSGGFDYASDYGTVTVNADGTITYAPNANYSGEEVFVFKTQDGGSTEDTTVTMTITPIADAPNLEADKTITTDEDVSIALGLQMPIITDATDQNGTAAGDDPERLGEITLSLTGTAIGTLTNAAGDTTYTDDGNGNYTFVIVDGIGNVDDNLHHNGITTGQAGVNYVTQTEYEAIKALPAADRHENFGVEVSVSSYEVDASGAALPDAEVGGANGAQSTQTITVDVLAVTDVVNLEVQQGAAQPDVTVAISGGDKVADVTLNEDNSFNLTSILNPDAFVDTDGSETRYLGIHGLPDGTTITVGGSSFVIGTSPIATFDFGDGNGAVPAIEIAGTQTALPVITITPPADFSGDINSLTVTLGARDSDSDSTVTPALVTDAVTINLHVNPIAGDVGLAANDVTTPEDTAVAFLENVEVTDTIVDGGTERITQVEFSLPTGWVLTDKPTGGEGSDWEITGSDALGYTITALASGYDLQTVLKDFTITPAPHSSVDETITVAVTSEDKNMVDGAEVISPTVTTNLDINVEVTAVAEELGPDLTMSGDYNYVTNAVEDVWFDLHQGSVLSGWENQDQDGSEETFALFTPALSDGINPVSANGSEFRYSTDGGATFVSQTYNGTAIEVPIAYLDTLQYKAPQDFAGNFEIQVTAKTVDTDPDTSDQSIWTGGSATLSGIVDPVADEVNLAVSGRARGDEDTDIPLNIRVSTSDIDASETITLTLSDIPAGAQLMYDGAALTLVDDGKGNGTFAVTIEEFDPSKPMTVRPPEHSNENFSIGLSAVSVDESGGVIDTSAAKTGQVEVIVRGVADDASLTVANPVFAEADVDAAASTVAIDGFGSVNLNQVITGTTLVDTDGSEKLTIKISGLEPEFHLVGGNFLGGTGTDRVWVLTQDQLANAKVLLPINFSGTVTANAVPITAENDGNAKSSPSVPLSFTVTPSIDETIKPSTSNLQEDSLHQVDFSLLAPSNDRIVDTDEELTTIWIAAADADTSDYTLYFGNAGKTLAQAVTDGDPGIVLDGSEYKITGAAISNVYAQGAPNAHGNFTFDVGYEITDPSTDGTLPATSERTNSTYTLEIEAVTDPATLVINSITADTASTTITGTTGVEAVENTALTVNVTLSKDPDANGNNERDYDGSETITKVFVDGVPAGVTVDGAVYIGNVPGSGNTGRWLLSGQPIGKSMTADETFDLVIGLTGSAANLSSLNQELSIRVATQDAGNSAEHVASDSFTLTTPATFDDTNSETDQPAVIVNWADEPTFVATEDTSFKLSDALVGEITGSSDFAITITGLPAGTVVSGMTMTDSDGNPNGFNTWTVSGAGSDADLQALLGSIEVNLPEHWNSNAYAGAEFEFDTTLTTYAGVGDRNAADARVSQVVTPVTDAAVITISNAETVNEDATVEFTVAIDNPADSAGNASNLVDGKLYLQITETDMAGGTLSYGGMSLALQNIVGVEGVADGQYYVADLGDGVGMGHGTSVVVSYQPPLHQSGTVSLEAWAPTKETDAANTVASVTSVDSNGEVAVVPVNDGFDIQAANVSGDEDSLIELAISGAGLIDNDGSEEVKSVLLTGLPDDFLVYVSNNADGSGAVLADNAGANGWAIPTVAGQLPPYVAVQPPLHWNGTASVGITALTGEKALLDVESSTTSFDIEVVPVADGLDIAPLNTSGTEGDIIAIDINPSLVDLNEAVNLQIEGLGEYAAFHLNGNLMTTGVSYDELTDTYTLNGLTEAELGQLGFVQSAGTYTVNVSAQTVDGTDVSTPVVTDSFIATINPVAPTAGDDTLLYGGLPIDAGAGDDTIQLRFGEDVTASDLASNLDNVEVLDLGVVGENAIGDNVAGLSIQDVLDITDSRNELKIDGDGDDSVFLKNSEWTNTGSDGNGYTVYTDTTSGASLSISEQITSITMVD